MRIIQFNKRPLWFQRTHYAHLESKRIMEALTDFLMVQNNNRGADEVTEAHKHSFQKIMLRTYLAAPKGSKKDILSLCYQIRLI